MQKFLSTAALAAVLALQGPLALPALAQPQDASAVALDQAIRYGWSRNWTAAHKAAHAAPDRLVVEINQWFRLRAGEGGFAEYEAFLDSNRDWPGLKLLREKGEATLPDNLSPDRVLAYFAGEAPQTGLGALRLALAYDALRQHGNAAATVTAAWRLLDMTEATEAQLLKRYKNELAPLHAARLDLLLWRGRITQAQRMLPLVPPADRKLAEVRIALQTDQRGVDAMISALPGGVADAAGLAYDRFRWRADKGYWDSAQEMMVARSASIAAAGRPEFWSDRRRTYARRAMRAKDYRTAYFLASHHYLTPDIEDYADLEWLSGYLALRKLDDPRLAARHFTNFRRAVTSPISIGRAGYWLGRTYEAMGDNAAADDAYALAATYQTSFYGQLAAERAGLPPDWTRQPFLRSESVRAAVLFHHAGYLDTSQRFFAHAAESMTPQQVAALAQFALDLDNPHAALKVAKVAAQVGQVMPRSYYPLMPLGDEAKSVPLELALAIIRQESEFNPQANSHAGARGLMQLMPDTARLVSKRLGQPYDSDRLVTDAPYNVRTGTAYLRQMLDRFGGSVILAAAAYNAGPNRVEQWIREYGDPRSPAVDAIDWIETIPFNETRNYVQRVAEALFVYRARLTGKMPRMRLGEELKAALNG